MEHNLGALATDAAGQLDVLWHDGDTLGVDGAEVGVLEEADNVRLGRLRSAQEAKEASRRGRRRGGAAAAL